MASKSAFFFSFSFDICFFPASPSVDTQFEISLAGPHKKGRKNSRTDIGDGGSNSDFDARVALLSQFTLEELVQLSVKDTVRNELAALGHRSLCSSHDCEFDPIVRKIGEGGGKGGFELLGGCRRRSLGGPNRERLASRFPDSNFGGGLFGIRANPQP